jgi:L-asparagine transporter-like permease
MNSNQPTIKDLKSKLKALNLIFYTVLLAWLILIVVILVRLFTSQSTQTLFIVSIPLVGALLILSQIKTRIKKEIENS